MQQANVDKKRKDRKRKEKATLYGVNCMQQANATVTVKSKQFGAMLTNLLTCPCQSA